MKCNYCDIEEFKNILPWYYHNVLMHYNNITDEQKKEIEYYMETKNYIICPFCHDAYKKSRLHNTFKNHLKNEHGVKGAKHYLTITGTIEESKQLCNKIREILQESKVNPKLVDDSYSLEYLISTGEYVLSPEEEEYFKDILCNIQKNN